jgi:hypothetical protein
MTTGSRRRSHAALFRTACVASAGLVVACSSPQTGPAPGVTLLVTNATCLTGHCDSLAILGFPANQPRTPGGLWSLDLGLLVGWRACLTLPASAIFRVIGVREGGADTTSYTWTSTMPLSLGAIPPSASRIVAGPSTATFVPADAAGWRITFPAGVGAKPGGACTP